MAGPLISRSPLAHRTPLLLIGVLGLMALTSVSSTAAVSGGKGLCNGDNYAFWFTVPDGWVVDNKTGYRIHVCAVAYPEGNSWDSSPAVMYVHSTPKRDTTLQSVLEEDVNHFKSQSPDLQVLTQPSIEMLDHSQVQVRRFIGKGLQKYEQVAYIDANETVSIFALSSKTKQAFESALGAFEQLVKSHQLLSVQAKRDVFKAVAKFDLERTGGKEYEARFIRHFGENHTSSMRRCSQQNPQDLQPFDLFAEVDEQGEISDISMAQSTPVALCLKKALLGSIFPMPPFAPFHIEIEMKIQR